jgi:putative acetyltransferase
MSFAPYVVILANPQKKQPPQREQSENYRADRSYCLVLKSRWNLSPIWIGKRICSSVSVVDQGGFPMAVTIRGLEPADFEAVRKIYSEPKVVLGTLQIPYQSSESWRKRLAEAPDGFYGLAACVDGEVIGHLGMQTYPKSPRRRHIGQLYMAVRDDHQGRGIGTALMQAVIELADRWLNLTRLELEVYVDNEPAKRLYKKFGFDIEGTARKFAFRNGEYADVYTLARVR